MDAPSTIKRSVAEARAGDAGRGIIRLDPDDLATLGLGIGDVVEIRGRHSAYPAPRTSLRTLRCVTSIPLGSPVEPDVNIT